MKNKAFIPQQEKENLNSSDFPWIIIETKEGVFYQSLQEKIFIERQLQLLY